MFPRPVAVRFSILGAVGYDWERGKIGNAKKVAALIALLDQAPIREGSNVGDTLDVFEFHLSDGTYSYLQYDPKTGWTDKDILLPPAFAMLIETAGVSLRLNFFS